MFRDFVNRTQIPKLSQPTAVSICNAYLLVQKLDDDEDDSHLDAQWSDPTALKRAFAGVGDVSWRPK